MSNAILGYSNAIDTATLTASSQVATLPAQNVQDPNLRKIWRTNGVTSASLQVDFGSAVAVGIVALLGVNFSAAATVGLKFSNAAPGGSEVYSQAPSNANVNSNYRQSVIVLMSGGLPATLSARYLEIDISDPSPITGSASFFTAQGIAPPTPYLDIGRVAALQAFQPQNNFAYGSGLYWIDPSVLSRSKGSTLFIDALPSWRHWEFSLARVAPSEAATVAGIRRLCKGVTDMLFIPDPLDLVSEHKQPLWGVIDLASTQDFLQISAPVNYAVAFKMDERL